MNKKIFAGSLILVLLVMLWLMACGGGGGGGPAAPVAQGPTYAINAASVESLVLSVEDMGVGCSLTDGATPAGALVRSVTTLSQQVADQVRGAYISKHEMEYLALQQEPAFKIDGSCATPGTVSVFFSEGDSGNFSGSLAFEDFCTQLVDSAEMTIVGGASFSGSIDNDPVTGEMVSFSLSAGTLPSGIVVTAADTETSIDVTGLSVGLNQAGDGFDITLDLERSVVAVTDAEGTETVTATNVSLAVSADETGAMTATLSGTFANAEGSMQVSTPQSIQVDEMGEIVGGQVLVRGAEGTSVKITHTDGYAFEVAADTTGDGVYDNYSCVMDCSGIQSMLPTM